MHRRQRFLVLFLALTPVAGGLGAGGVWWYHTSRPRYQLRQGQEALRAGDEDEAQRAADRLEDLGYADHAHLLRGEAYLRRRQIGPAIRELNAIQDDQFRFDAAVVYGLGFLSLKDLYRAEHLLRFVLEKDPDHLDAHRGLATLYF